MPIMQKFWWLISMPSRTIAGNWLRSANETAQTPAMQRFIEKVTVLILQYEDELDPGPAESPNEVLKFLMEERGLRQVDLVPILGSKSYMSQILSGHRPISR